MSAPRRLHGRLIEATLWSSLEALARGGCRLLPTPVRRLKGVRLERDVRYGPHGERNLLDVYVPEGDGPFPVALYIHGGGFRILSKDTHWMMALQYAARGFVVFVPNYRLAPSHCFPAAVEDACEAYLFALEHAGRYGGDPTRRIVSGESAGGNLSLVLALASCARAESTFARRVFDANAVPTAAVPMCGIYEVSDARRFARRRALAGWIEAVLIGLEECYLANGLGRDPWLANPLSLLESSQEISRTLPPVFTSIGTRDPLLDDTRRLERALLARGAHVEVQVYPGELHAFQAFFMLRAGRDHWRRAFAFLESAAGLSLGASGVVSDSLLSPG